jgi:DNA-binding response OmpR family regulator
MESKPPIVLFASPDAVWMRPLQNELRQRGAEVFRATDRGQALRTAELARPDLIVLDDDLPSDPGEDLPETLKVSLPDAEVILLSSPSEGCPRGTGLGLLFSGSKPISGETLMEVIEPVLGSRLSHTPA